MLNLFVETKNEYTTHLINILSPLIFEGIQSIYKDAQKTSNETEILKIFQTYLKRIPRWNQDIINKETERIMTCSHSYEWLDSLIKATLKSNLVILMHNPTIKSQEKLDKSYYINISSSDFIHKTYIECAREIWNNPYLFYHCYPPIEIKRNQRDCIILIKDCIKEAIRKLLPVKHILNVYLGEDDKTDTKSIIDSEMSKLTEEKQLEYNCDNSDSRTVGSRILDIIGDEPKNKQDITPDLVSSSASSASSVAPAQAQAVATGPFVSSAPVATPAPAPAPVQAATQAPAPVQAVVQAPGQTSTEQIINEDVSSVVSSLKLGDTTSDAVDEAVKSLDDKINQRIKDGLKYDEANITVSEPRMSNDRVNRKYLSIFSNSDNKDNKTSRIFKNFRDF